jgi:hypothetical protein
MKPSSLIKLPIVALIAFAISPFCAAQSQLAGDWQGTLEGNGATYHVAWHVLVAKDGTVTSTFDNNDEGILGIKVKSTTVKGTDITMSVDDVVSVNGQDAPIRGEFIGVISADGNEVNGTWTQTEPDQPPAQVHFKRAAAVPATAPATLQ